MSDSVNSKSSGVFFIMQQWNPVLPSIKLLQIYKNCFEQTPGVNSNMLHWMFKEAKRLNVDMRG